MTLSSKNMRVVGLFLLYLVCSLDVHTGVQAVQVSHTVRNTLAQADEFAAQLAETETRKTEALDSHGVPYGPAILHPTLSAKAAITRMKAKSAAKRAARSSSNVDHWMGKVEASIGKLSSACGSTAASGKSECLGSHKTTLMGLVKSIVGFRIAARNESPDTLRTQQDQIAASLAPILPPGLKSVAMRAVSGEGAPSASELSSLDPALKTSPEGVGKLQKLMSVVTEMSSSTARSSSPADADERQLQELDGGDDGADEMSLVMLEEEVSLAMESMSPGLIIIGLFALAAVICFLYLLGLCIRHAFCRLFGGTKYTCKGTCTP
eukprot:GFYU01011366.1.p1 GENE.GFYU01011366.1~~GFYU01011366.1.p1  ORF type:complete len:322 (-),score=63.41 GFYU01011366.1:213-1178(-)